MADQTNSHHPSQQSLRLGFGASGAWSQRWFSETKAHQLVAHAVEHGITHFDTASFYANGLAESRLGRALSKMGNRTIEISTKTGTLYQFGNKSTKDFSASGIRRDVERSLKRLKREQLDILYLHGPNNAEIGGALETLAALKQEGKIKLAGVCGFRAALIYAVHSRQIDIIMGTYNVLNPSYAPEFEAAKLAGMRTVGIATLVPRLGDKRLTRPKSFADIWYLLRTIKHGQPSMTKARQDLREIAQRHGYSSVVDVMLGFALAQPNIDTILTNTTRFSHLDANIQTAQSPRISDDLLTELEQFSARYAPSLLA